MLIGQLRFALIDFKRSFLASAFSFVSQIITYSALTIGIGLISFTLPYLNRVINDAFYRSYMLISILFVIVCVIIGGVVVSRSIDLKFQSQRDDIAVMKNVGGKSRWIYSYFIFNQLLTAVIMLLLGLVVGLILIIIVLAAFNNLAFFKNIRFLSILGANIAILIVSYLKAHYTILKFIGEKNLEISSSRLSNYKSIFEFGKLISKFKSTIKMGIKNFLRSGKIISSFVFSFFLVFSSLSFILGPLTIAETHLYHIDARYGDYSYMIGDPEIVCFYNNSIEMLPYENTSFTDDIDYRSFFTNRTLEQAFINEVNMLEIPKQAFFITKMEVTEIPYLDVINGVYVDVGSNRTFYATIVGYSENFFEEDLFMWGEEPLPGNKEIIVGDSLERVLFENSSVQKIRFTNETNKFAVSGAIIDSFAAGFTIYVPMNQLIQEGITTGPNAIVIGDINQEIYNDLKEISENYSYDLDNTSEVIEKTKRNYKNFSNTFTSLGGELFLIFSFQIVVFSFLYFLSYRKDFGLLYDLGIRKRKIYGISITATILQIIPGLILGSYLGSVIARYFLVPNARLTYYVLILFGIILFYILIVIIGSISAGRRGLNTRYL